MKLQDLTLQTTIEEIRTSRSSIINYARLIFERTEPSAIYAFAQFKDDSDVLKLILAKKKGLFDYGKLIERSVDGKHSWSFPHPWVVMDSLSKELSIKDAKTLSFDDLADKLSNVPWKDIKISKDFEVSSGWGDLSEEERVEETRDLLTKYYKKYGHRELQRKHYEIMRTNTARGESSEDIIDRIVNSGWKPLDSRKKDEQKHLNSWTRARQIGETDMSEYKIKISQLENTVASLRDDIEFLKSLNQRLDNHEEDLENLKNLIKDVTSEGSTKSIFERTAEAKAAFERAAKDVIKAKKYDEKDLLKKPFPELLEIAEELKIPNASNIRISRFLVKKIIEAS